MRSALTALGIIIGVGIRMAIGAAAGALGAHVIGDAFGWPTHVSTNAVLIATGFVGSIGIFFGFYPASKAASLDPINALRYE